MTTNNVSDSDSRMPLVERSMLTPDELSARIGVPVATLQTWRTRRNAGQDVGPKFVKLSNQALGGRRSHVRYMIEHVEQWEQSLAESAA
jgi:hypothetical protein